MATKNSINNVSQDLTVDPGTSGDSFIQFDINAAGEFRIGVDDDDSDAFKISQGSTLGTNDTFIVTDQGEITKPLQPAFLAIMTSNKNNVTGANAVYIGDWDSEIFDQGGDFDGISTFTAPITGRYLFQGCFTVGPLQIGSNSQVINLRTSDRRYTLTNLRPENMMTVNNELNFEGSILADMDASDTAIFEVQVSGGSQTVDVLSNGASDPLSWFSGSLQC
jgi:hypothetical protein